MPNVGSSDSDGHKSDNAALQVMTTITGPCDTHDMVRFSEKVTYIPNRE